MIKQATQKDVPILAKLAIQMWNDNTLSGLESEFSDIIGSENAACFIKYVEDKPVGFAQCQLRYDYVEGTETSPVGYLEGIFIQEEFRDLQKSFCKNARSGQAAKNAPNLQVIVN